MLHALRALVCCFVFDRIRKIRIFYIHTYPILDAMSHKKMDKTQVKAKKVSMYRCAQIRKWKCTIIQSDIYYVRRRCCSAKNRRSVKYFQSFNIVIWFWWQFKHIFVKCCLLNKLKYVATTIQPQIWSFETRFKCFQ